MNVSVICNADDFGITDGASKGIAECFHAGSVTSTTWLANMPASAKAAELAKECPGLGVGLHFNLTLGRPLASRSEVGSLIDESSGSFLTRRGLIRRTILGGLKSIEVARELDAQLAKMNAYGLKPTHIDSHQHVHALPVVFREVARAAKSMGIPIRVPASWPGRKVRPAVVRGLKEVALQLLCRRSLQYLDPNTRVNNGLCSVFDLNLDSRSINESSYYDLLKVYKEGVVELMVHPAIVDGELRGMTEISQISGVEYDLLRSGCIGNVVEMLGGRLCNYGDAW